MSKLSRQLCGVCGRHFARRGFRTCSVKCAENWNAAITGMRKARFVDEGDMPEKNPQRWLADFAVRILQAAMCEIRAPSDSRPVALRGEILTRLERYPVAPQGREETGFNTRHRRSLEAAWLDVPRKHWPCRLR